MSGLNIGDSNLPLVSIIIPAFNSERYIGETIMSCLNQTYKKFELIIINDGSTDNTDMIINQYLSDIRIKYLKINNIGPCNARNLGIKQAKGQLYQFLDHDDIISKNKLKNQLLYYFKNGDDYIYSSTMGSVSGTTKTLDKGYELYQKDFIPQEYFETVLNQFGKYITTGAWLIPSKLIEATKGWDSRAGLNDDGEYFMRIILNSVGIIYCKKSKFYFRRDVPNSLSKQFNTKKVYINWLFSYSSYVENFLKKFEGPVARRLGWKALSIYYCCSYPHYPDLLEKCKNQIKILGYKDPSPYGGTRFIWVSKFLGVHNALLILNVKNKIFK